MVTDTRRYVDELESVDDLDKHAAPPLVCFTEALASTRTCDDHVSMSMIAITPSTGDVVWDEFDGGFGYIEFYLLFTHSGLDTVMRSELEVSALFSQNGHAYRD